MQFKGNLIGFTNALWTSFELLGSETKEELTTARVKMLGKHSLNDLLKATIDTVDYQQVNPIVPSMNDIFIQAIATDEKELVNEQD